MHKTKSFILSGIALAVLIVTTAIAKPPTIPPPPDFPPPISETPSVYVAVYTATESITYEVFVLNMPPEPPGGNWVLVRHLSQGFTGGNYLSVDVIDYSYSDPGQFLEDWTVYGVEPLSGHQTMLYHQIHRKFLENGIYVSDYSYPALETNVEYGVIHPMVCAGGEKIEGVSSRQYMAMSCAFYYRNTSQNSVWIWFKGAAQTRTGAIVNFEMRGPQVLPYFSGTYAPSIAQIEAVVGQPCLMAAFHPTDFYRVEDIPNLPPPD